MQYRKLVKDGPDISLLGYGCMRLPTKGMIIDKELTFSQMKLAFDSGVNYFDTAYPYHAGKSEVVLGEFIKKYKLRDKLYIADKLPTTIVTKPEHIRKYFDTQIERLDTDCIDFYLMHMLGSLSDWEKLKSFGILEFIEQKKAAGQIKYIGFSFHGKAEEFIKILEDYDWEFCQIQFNYLDEYNQAGLAGLRRAHELGIGVAVMEPLRGGLLAANAPDKVKKILEAQEDKKSAAYHGLRFVMNHDGVSTVLSGMNVTEHIVENIKVASETTVNSMSEAEHKLIDEVKAIYAELMKVPCTGCGYCMPCPFGVDIPNTFNDYNSLSFFGKKAGMAKLQYMGKAAGIMGDKAGANLCTSCGKCKRHCPQNIDIPLRLKEAHRALSNKALAGIFALVAKVIGKRSN